MAVAQIKFEIIKYGAMFGFFKERGTFVVYLGPFMIIFTKL